MSLFPKTRIAVSRLKRGSLVPRDCSASAMRLPRMRKISNSAVFDAGREPLQDSALGQGQRLRCVRRGGDCRADSQGETTAADAYRRYAARRRGPAPARRSPKAEPRKNESQAVVPGSRRDATPRPFAGSGLKSAGHARPRPCHRPGRRIARARRRSRRRTRVGQGSRSRQRPTQFRKAAPRPSTADHVFSLPRPNSISVRVPCLSRGALRRTAGSGTLSTRRLRFFRVILARMADVLRPMPLGLRIAQALVGTMVSDMFRGDVLDALVDIRGGRSCERRLDRDRAVCPRPRSSGGGIIAPIAPGARPRESGGSFGPDRGMSQGGRGLPLDCGSSWTLLRIIAVAVVDAGRAEVAARCAGGPQG
jgi:hypothetical protein